MIRYFLALLFILAVADAGAQTRTHKKMTPYSTRGPRKPAANINPHTGKPYGAGVSQDIKDGNAYLAPGVPMRKQEGYRANGGYNDNRTSRPVYKKTNSSLSRDNSAPAVVPAKSKRKSK